MFYPAKTIFGFHKIIYRKSLGWFWERHFHLQRALSFLPRIFLHIWPAIPTVLLALHLLIYGTIFFLLMKPRPFFWSELVLSLFFNFDNDHPGLWIARRGWHWVNSSIAISNKPFKRNKALAFERTKEKPRQRDWRSSSGPLVMRTRSLTTEMSRPSR